MVFKCGSLDIWPRLQVRWTLTGWTWCFPLPMTAVFRNNVTRRRGSHCWGWKFCKGWSNTAFSGNGNEVLPSCTFWLPKVWLLVEASSKWSQELWLLFTQGCKLNASRENSWSFLHLSNSTCWALNTFYWDLQIPHWGKSSLFCQGFFKLELLISAHILLFGLETTQCNFAFFGQELFSVYSHTKERECSDKLVSSSAGINRHSSTRCPNLNPNFIKLFQIGSQNELSW